MKKLLISLFAVGITSWAQAQFLIATMTDRPVPSYIPYAHIYNVQNHSYSNADIGGNPYDLYAACWDDAGNQVYYKQTLPNNPNTIINEGYLTIPDASMVKDVAIIKNPNTSSQDEYCIAVVYSANMPFTGGAKMAIYEWTTAGFNFVTDYIFSNDPIWYMRLDAIDEAAYTVVFHDNNNVLKAFGGYTRPNIMGYPLFGNVKEIFDGIPVQGLRPDICMTKLNSLTGTPDEYTTYYSYISLDQSTCYVGNMSFNDLAISPGPLVNSTNIHTISNYYSAVTDVCTVNDDIRYPYFAGPQIDAPDYGEGSWAVIVQQAEAYAALNCNDPNPVVAANFMIGAHSIGGNPATEFPLNNGSLSGTVDMATYTGGMSLHNYGSQPAVAYSDKDYVIQFGWGKTQEHPSLGNHDYLAAVIDIYSNDIIPDAAGNLGYRIIDKDDSFEPYIRCLAFSGNNYNIQNLYTMFTNSISNASIFPEHVYDKHPDFAFVISDGFNAKAPANIPSSTNLMQLNNIPNPFAQQLEITVNGKYISHTFDMQVADITGSVLLTKTGNIDEINLHLNNWASSSLLVNGMYILQLHSIESKETSQLKIIRQK